MAYLTDRWVLTCPPTLSRTRLTPAAGRYAFGSQSVLCMCSNSALSCRSDSSSLTCSKLGQRRQHLPGQYMSGDHTLCNAMLLGIVVHDNHQISAITLSNLCVHRATHIRARLRSSRRNALCLASCKRTKTRTKKESKCVLPLRIMRATQTSQLSGMADRHIQRL